MKYKLKYFSLLLFYGLSFPIHCDSQGQWNNWVFGHHAGLNFNSGIPIPISTVNPGFVALPSCATASDSSGNLLFYANCFMKQYVYNRNNDTMPNGFLYNGYDVGPVQIYFVVQDLADDSSYFLFTVRSPSVNSGGLFYSVINMRLDGGLGDIAPGEKLIPVPNGEWTGHIITGTRHHNNKDAWLVTRNRHNSYKYLSYLITSSGLNTTPIQSQSTIFVNSLINDQLNYIKISPDGMKLVCLYDNEMEYCSFNSYTGVVTPLFQIKCQNGMSKQFFNCGAEWSVDNKYLYVTCEGVGPYGTGLFQYDATKNDSASFKQSEVLITDDYPDGFESPQRGVDNKIYLPHGWVDSLDVINDPSIQGLGCNYQMDALCLLPTNTTHAFPQFLQYYKAYIHDTGYCQNRPVNFSGDIWPPPDSIHWDFGDPSAGVLNYSNLAEPAHIYQNTGTYTVELFVKHVDHRTDTSWQTVTIVDSPLPALGQDRNICTGDSVILDAGSWMNSTYSWDNLSLGLMNIASTQTYYAKTTGSYRVTVTNSNGCSGMDTVLVNLTTSPVVTNNPLAKSICSGESTNITLTSSPSGANFHWTATMSSGTVSGFSADSGTMINQVLINTLPTPGIVTYHITPKLGSCSGSMVDFAVTVNPGVPVTISISASQNNVCAGTMVTFTAAPGNQGASPVYQWKVNGITQPGNLPTFSYTPTNNDVVSCILTSSNINCTSNNPATSNAITMVILPLQPVSVLVNALNPVCAGNSVIYTATPTNGGLSPTCQWFVNAVLGGSGPAPTYTYVPLNGDIITCTVLSNATCSTNNPATSPPVTMTVNPNLAVGISISTPSNPFCLGSAVTFTGVPVNGAPASGAPTPTFQWIVNGMNVGPNTNIYTYTPSNGDLVSCILTSSIPCPIGNPVTSNTITMLQNNSLPASVSITPSSNPFCPGTSVIYTAAPTHGGPTPAYQWKVNGVNVGTNSNTYSYNPNNGDSIRVIMTSNLACVTGSPASSSKIIMSGTLAPIVLFNACFDTITTLNAKPIKLKGGIPLGGTYSGPGVNPMTSYFNPALVGVGTKTINYTFTNAALCAATASVTIVTLVTPVTTCGSPLTDVRDSKTYQTVQIGGQCWLSTNLNFGNVLASSQDQRDNCIAEKYCYNDSPINCTNHGGLYQWDELMLFDATSAAQGFCPPGWHIPSENDWNILFATYINSGFAGSPLKYSGYSGFNALLSGARHINKGWELFGFATFFWSSTSRSDTKAWAHGMNEVDPSVSLYPASRANAFSVRCLKD